MARHRGRGARRARRLLVGTACAAIAGALPAHASADVVDVGATARSYAGTAEQSSPDISAREATVHRFSAVVTVVADGSLAVVENYMLLNGAGGTEGPDFRRTITTREQYDADNDRVYDISDVDMSVGGDPVEPVIRKESDSMTIEYDFSDSASDDEAAGTWSVQVAYAVDGTVAQTADGLEVRWPVVQGLSLPIDSARVDWNAPGVVWLSCLAGEPGSSRPCTTAQLIDSPTPRMTQEGLAVGDQMVGILGLTAESGIEASVELKPRWSLSRAFTASGTPLWLALGIVVLGVLAAFGLWWTRGRDAASAGVEPVEPLASDADGTVQVAPPGAVRPGQMGTLVDERADVVDVTATIVDLATRNYLFIEEIPRGQYERMDWRLRRRDVPGDQLLPFEHEVLSAVFATADDILVSELPAAARHRLAAIQGLMYDDLVRQGWFAERPDAVRGRWSTAGVVLALAGAVLTVTLALAGTFGLVGVAVIIAGIALALAGQLAPARTAKGAMLLGELLVFRSWLELADFAAVPADQREQVVSRLYPYALVFGLGDRWAVALADLDEDPDPDAPLYWYGAPEQWHLSDIAPSLAHLAAALGAALGSRSLLDPS